MMYCKYGCSDQTDMSGDLWKLLHTFTKTTTLRERAVTPSPRRTQARVLEQMAKEGSQVEARTRRGPHLQWQNQTELGKVNHSPASLTLSL